MSTGGGIQVTWGPDGQELFYIGPDGQLMTVHISLDSATGVATTGRPEPLFQTTIDQDQGANRQAYDVSSDGQRFLMLMARPGAQDDTPTIRLLLNWWQDQ